MQIIDVNGNQRECVEAYPDKDYPGYMRIEFKNAVRSHHEWYPIEDFIKNNPNLSHLASHAPQVTEEVVGVVTGATDKELTDGKQKWNMDVYKGFPVWISRGFGEGQVRTVISNNQNTLIINSPWKQIPNKTSQYVISHNIHEPQVLGNTLPQSNTNIKKSKKR